MNHNIEDRDEAIQWAQNVLANPSEWAILDTETTGISIDDVVIQVGIIDLNENILIDSLVRPTQKKSISIEATDIHGITMEMLLSAPILVEIIEDIIKITKQKKIIIYNAEFDIRLLNQTIYQDKINIPKGKLFMNYKCAMIYYAQFVGQWSDYYQNYVYQKLPSSQHNAIGDCKATLEIIKTMARTRMGGSDLLPE